MKKTFKRKLIGMLLMAMLIVGMLPTAVLAAGTDGGTAVLNNNATIDREKKASVTIIKTSDENIAEEGETPEYERLAGAEFMFFPLDIIDRVQDADQNYTIQIFPNAWVKGKLGYTEEQIADPAFLQEHITELADTITAEIYKYIEHKDQVFTADFFLTTDENGTARKDDVRFGYYLVMEIKAPEGHIASEPFILSVPQTNNVQDSSMNGTEWIYDITVQPKNSSVSLTKTNDNPVAEIGETVNYEIKTTVPDYSTISDDTEVTFTICDKLGKGLTYTDDSIAVKVDGTTASDSAYTFQKKENQADVDENDETEFEYTMLEIAFASDFIKQNSNKDVVITYSAAVNENAVVTSEGNPNKAVLKYTDKTDSTNTTSEVESKVYSVGIKVAKVGEDGTTPLQGAEFTLLDENREVFRYGTSQTDLCINASVDENGILNVQPLGEGTYYLRETKSPAGYALLRDDIRLEITADTSGITPVLTVKAVIDGKYTTLTRADDASELYLLTIQNVRGFSLPSTGGTGIYASVIGGVVLMAVVAAIAVAVLSKKKNGKAC